MKEKIRNIFLILLLAVFILYLLVTGFLELTNKKDVKTVTVDAAYTALKMQHSINYIIPTGTDYYYIGIDAEKKEAYVIKASEKWLDKNFDDELMSYDEGGLKVQGLNKRVSDSKTRRLLLAQVDKLTGYSFPLGKEACLYVSYVSTSVLKIILAVLVVILTIVTVKIPKIAILQKKPLMILYCVALLTAICIMLTVIR